MNQAISKIKSVVNRNITNALGWKTKRKIVVIESDDWGSIRVPSKEAYNKLKDWGFAVDKCHYMQNDSLESNKDLEILFDCLTSRQKTPVITANFLTANPDFERIKQNDFQNYFNESLEATLAKYPAHDKVKSYWLEGKDEGFFYPQLHGREHLNIGRWMHDLQTKNVETLQAFQLHMFGVSAHIVKKPRQSYQAAFDHNPYMNADFFEIIQDAVVAFNKLFSFSPKTFIAPNYVWGSEIEKITSQHGITHLQGTNTQRLPKSENNHTHVKRNILGKKNEFNQAYLIRNCTFEPFSNPNFDWINNTLREISNAFFWNKPAIISMHRVNFIGSINGHNRMNNIKQLKQLLDQIDRRWPEVEYMSSEQLAKIL